VSDDPVARPLLLAQIGGVDRALAAASKALPPLHRDHQDKLREALRDGAGWLAMAATGDAQAIEELRVVKARVLLWGWAGAEQARQAWVTALREWLSRAVEALAEAGAAVLELGLKALVEAGLNQLDKE